MNPLENQASKNSLLDRLGIAKDKVSVKLGNEDQIVQKEIKKAINFDRTDPVEEIIKEIKERLEEVTDREYSEEEIGLIWILKGGEMAETHLEKAEEKYNSEDLADSGLVEMRQEAVEAERIFDRCLSVVQSYDFNNFDFEEVSLQKIQLDGEEPDKEAFENEISARINSFHQNSEKAEQIYRKAEQQLNNIPEF
ncbi:MAG: hypothetical protein R6V35_05150 [Candidatus Nanohaloarchaea archaeon]